MGRAEIKCNLMPQHHRTAAHAPVSTGPIFLQDFCLYNITVSINHRFCALTNSCIYIHDLPPTFKHKFFREQTSSSLLYQILAVLNSPMPKYDVQAVRTRDPSLHCTHLQVTTFDFFFKQQKEKNQRLPSIYFLTIPNFFFKFQKPQRGLIKNISAFSGSKILARVFNSTFLNAFFYRDRGEEQQRRWRTMRKSIS